MKRLFFNLFCLLTLASMVPARASGPTLLFVDPNWAGTASGTSNQPWSTLNQPATAQWTAIRSALLTNDVTIFLDPLQADGVTQNREQNWYIESFRNDGTNAAHSLVFDGGAYYNTSESSPFWKTNPTPPQIGFNQGKVFCVTGLFGGAGYPGQGYGWSRGSKYAKQSLVTYQYIEFTGDGAAGASEGDTNLWQWFYFHDTTTIGACLTLLYTIPDSATLASQQIMAPCTNWRAIHGVCSNTYGENIYLGGIDPNVPTNVQAALGNQHHSVEVGSNLLYGAGVNGAGGSGVNTKNGIIGLWVHDNEISHAVNQQWGINCGLSQDGTPQNDLIERNIIHDNAGPPASGIYCVGDSNMWGATGVVIQNNLIYSNGGVGVKIAAFSSSVNTYGLISNVSALNNTLLYNLSTGLTCNNAILASLTNNLVISNATSSSFSPNIAMSTVSGGVINSDYNAWAPNWSWGGEGSHSFAITGTNVFTNPNAANFLLLSGAPNIGNGYYVSGMVDLYMTARWNPPDIGAIQFSPPTWPFFMMRN